MPKPTKAQLSLFMVKLRKDFGRLSRSQVEQFIRRRWRLSAEAAAKVARNA